MLKSLDILIAFSSVMLLVSVAVTLLTQAVTGALGWRGRNLLRGVITILNQIDPKATPFCTEQIAGAVLRHPLVAPAEGKPGTVIQREELIRILLELGAGREPGGKLLDEYARSTLKRALETNGIADPAEVLENIHLLGLKLEGLHPELSAPVRHSMAVAAEARTWSYRANFPCPMPIQSPLIRKHISCISLLRMSMGVRCCGSWNVLFRRFVRDQGKRSSLVTSLYRYR